jgi:hypothetical protein
MRPIDSHLSDEELLSAVDGELSEHEMRKAGDHLAACWDCRARLARLEVTIAGVVESRHEQFDTQLPPDAGRRALLKARLSELAAQDEQQNWRHVFSRISRRRALVIGFSTAILLIAATTAVFRFGVRDSSVISAEGPLEPSRTLTPGATRNVNLREVCGGAAAIGDSTSARVIPISTQRQVFQEYGINGTPAKDYEVDFLITPELGGSNDIHNLWPEPYRSPVWNAHVKDELEDRLHEMVCDGEIDLRTAQRDISSDWILAYKKYLHTDRPL